MYFPLDLALIQTFMAIFLHHIDSQTLGIGPKRRLLRLALFFLDHNCSDLSMYMSVDRLMNTLGQNLLMGIGF